MKAKSYITVLDFILSFSCEKGKVYFPNYLLYLMKTSKAFFILVLILFPLTQSHAQKGIFARADKEYNLLRFKPAIQYYLKGLRSDSLNQTSIERLANSYRNIKDYKNAEIWYAKAVSLNPESPDNNLHYAEALANIGKYESSEMWYRRYLTLNKGETRADIFAKINMDVSEFYTDSVKWKVRFTSLNTGFDEFGPVFFKEGLIFASNRSPGNIKYISGWDMKPFTDLYYISDTNNIKPIDVKGRSEKMTAMMAGDDTPTTIHDNRTLGDFNLRSLSGITEYDYGGEFTSATQLKGAFKSKLNDGPVSFPADESWMMFTRNSKYKAYLLSKKNINKLQLFSARSTRGKWTDIESFPYNNNEYSTGYPALSNNGNILYFSSDMPGGYGGMDLYYCVRMGYSWTKPVNLGDKVNTEGDEMFPFLDRQGNLYFSSTGLPGLGGQDIFYVSIKEYLPSGQAKNLGYPVNSSKDDFGIVANPNGLSGYFSSNRRGNDDIYRFDHDPMAEAIETLAEAVKEPVIKAVGEELPVLTDLPAKNTEISKVTPEEADHKGLTGHSENGIGVRIDDRNIDGTQLLVQHQTAVPGSVIKITHPANGKSVFAKVAGKLTDNARTKGALIAITKATADAIGASDRRFKVTIEHGVQPVTEEPVKLVTEPARPVTEPISVPEPVRSAPEPIRGAEAIRTGTDPVNGIRISLAENISTITTISASDDDAGTTFRYSLSGGVDGAKFRINTSNGALSFVSAPDFENPTDADGNNTYIAVLRVSDGTNITDQVVIVTITDVNDNSPVFTSNAAVSIPENISAITTIMATDADAGTTFSYSLSGGTDGAKFLINSSSGVLSFISAPDFERPADGGGNNTYTVVVRTSDGTNTTDQTVSVNVTDVNDNAPVIISNAAIPITENNTAVTTVRATDADAGTTFSYSLSGGGDVTKFSINSSSGDLTFISPPDFERSADADGNNTYITVVRVSDGTNSSDQTVVVTITDVNDSTPVITSNAAVSTPENISAVTTVRATDADAGTTFSYSLSGGADVAKFLINSSSGILSFISAPDFERPADVGANNTYIAVVRASDGTNTTDQTVVVSVTDVNDNAPVITSNAMVSIPENTTAVISVKATDADAESTFIYSLSGGADAAKFYINSSSGVLTFIAAPDYEKPSDADANNKYIVVIRASDGANTADQTLTITITDVNDNAPVIKL